MNTQMNRVATITFGAVAAMALHVGAATISVTPADDLVAKVATANDGDTIQLSAGTFEIESQIALANKSNITFTGAGKDQTFVVVKDGVSSRHVSLSGMANVKFDGISFRNAKLEYSSSDASSTQGGSFRVENTANLQIDNCSFVSNTLQNTATASPAVDLKGGAFQVTDSDIHFNGCDFVQNGVRWSAANTSDKYGYGGVISMSTPTGASTSTLRLNFTATNCVFRNNFLSIRANGTTSRSYGGIAHFYAVGADFYNCLIVGTHATPDDTKTLQIVDLICHQTATKNYPGGGFHRYTKCTIADNAVSSCFDAWVTWGTPVINAILDRSVVSGHWRDLNDQNNLGAKAILIDSVYTSGQDPANNVTWYGKKYTSSNWAKAEADSLFVNDYDVAPGSAAAERGAGWQLSVARSYNDWYVAVDGSDANAGSSVAPFRTLTKAVSVAGNGDTIHLGAGKYTATAGEVFPIAITDKYGLTIAGAGKGVTIIDGEGDTTGKTAFQIARCFGLRVKDLSIEGMDPKASAAGTPIVLDMASCGRPVFSGVGICNNTLTAQYKVQLTGVSRVKVSNQVEFDDCLVTNNVDKMMNQWGTASYVTGWLMYSENTYLILNRCSVLYNGWDSSRLSQDFANYMHSGLLVYSTSPNAQRTGCLNVHSCLFAGNGQVGGTRPGGTVGDGYIYIKTSDPATLENCTFVDNPNGRLAWFAYPDETQSGFYNCIVSHTGAALAYSSKKPVAKDTLFSNTVETDSTLANFNNYATFAADGVVLGADPKFKDAANGDYHLTKDSALAIDKGATRGWMMADAKDLDGNARVVGYLKRSNPLPDIGCYELPCRRPGTILAIR